MRNQVWFVPREQNKLLSPFKLHDDSFLVKKAKPFTANIQTVVVGEDLDGWPRGNNDLLIMTSSSLGESPRVQRIHFYEEEIKVGQPIQNIFSNNIYATEDYPGSRLWLKINVVEIDKDTGERKALIDAFSSLVAQFGAVFPAVAPYTFAAATVVGVINKLALALEKNERVIHFPFALYGSAGIPGNAPLQLGNYIVFSKPINDPSKYTYNESGTLEGIDDNDKVSYVVFYITDKILRSPEFITNQKVATLLTQLNGNDQTPKATVDFLSETLSGYSNFKRLKRYIDLKNESSRTEDEENLMKEISKISEIKEFLPK